jgi:hypothetical protein
MSQNTERAHDRFRVSHEITEYFFSSFFPSYCYNQSEACEIWIGYGERGLMIPSGGAKQL